MKNYSFVYVMIVALFFNFSLHAKNTGDAKEFIETLGKEAIETLTDPKTPESEIESRFTKYLDRDFAIPEIATFVLGKYNRSATSEQKEKFQLIFRERLKKSYASRFKQYKGVKFSVKSATPNTQANRADVKSTIQENKPNAPVVSVEWKVKKSGGTWLIFDVIIDGVSMAATLRSEYASAITQHGSLEKFIESKGVVKPS